MGMDPKRVLVAELPEHTAIDVKYSLERGNHLLNNFLDRKEVRILSKSPFKHVIPYLTLIHFKIITLNKKG